MKNILACNNKIDFLIRNYNTKRLNQLLQFLLLLILTSSCKNPETGSPSDKSISALHDSLAAPLKNIRFSYVATRINDPGETIEVNALLINENPDTVYFLSTTCFGEQYSLVYDTTTFKSTPKVLCHTSGPKIISIPPGGKYEFGAHFRPTNQATKIKLGFDFYAVDKSFDLSIRPGIVFQIFNRPFEKQTIIWADEQLIN